jgi:hypothetical protein
VPAGFMEQRSKPPYGGRLLLPQAGAVPQF